jgi:PhnB protein
MSPTNSYPAVQTYLFFEGRCEEALDFYKQAIGADVKMVMRFKDSPEPPQPGPGGPVPGEKILHAEFRVGDTTVLVSDGHCSGKPTFVGFGLALNPPTEADASHLFHALADGGQVTMPLAKTFFSPAFGMVTDKFGVLWMIMVRP